MTIIKRQVCTRASLINSDCAVTFIIKEIHFEVETHRYYIMKRNSEFSSIFTMRWKKKLLKRSDPSHCIINKRTDTKTRTTTNQNECLINSNKIHFNSSLDAFFVIRKLRLSSSVVSNILTINQRLCDALHSFRSLYRCFHQTFCQRNGIYTVDAIIILCR